MQLIECVPNFSEGRDTQKIKKISDAIESSPGIRLLSVEPGVDTHRTVMTFLGSPEAVAQAAFQAIKKASELIDMSKHTGTHPRIGATDVCPFVPVEGVGMAECIEVAKKVGKRVGEELKIPVFLYEEAATTGNRKNLADIRKGEYEGLAEKLKLPEWKPDFGPAEFCSKSGATVIGAREFLIAYNITLNTSNLHYATDIAYELREKGRVARVGNIHPFYFKGEKLISDGQNVYKPGKFKHCKAIGWYVGEYKRAQISINLTHFKITPPHLVLEEARRLADERGLIVTGSEIVGLIPYAALLEAGKYYLQKQNGSTGVPVRDILNTAVFSMGLNDTTPFELERKVIGMPEIKENALVKMKVSDFADEVSRNSPAPGGGSIAALAGSLGAALAAMVANLSFGKENKGKDQILSSLAERAQKLKDELLVLVDKDTEAFQDYLVALRLPQNNPEEIKLREEKAQSGLKKAAEVPWKTAQMSFQTMELASVVLKLGNKNSLTDAATGVQMGYSGVRSGIWNVLFNLKNIKDLAYKAEMQKNSAELLAKARDLLENTEKQVDELMQT